MLVHGVTTPDYRSFGVVGVISLIEGLERNRDITPAKLERREQSVSVSPPLLLEREFSPYVSQTH